MAITPPRISKNLPILRDLQDYIELDETLMSSAFQNDALIDIDEHGFAANDVTLDKVDATGAKLERTSFSDIVITKCTLLAAKLAEASWRRVTIKDSRCSGLQLQNSTLHDVSFVNCKLDLVNFRFSKLTDVQFVDCVLTEADFYAAELKNVTFQKCILTKAQFSTSKLKNVDLRTSDIGGVKSVRSLAGVTIDSTQLIGLAQVFANELSIIVKDN